MNPGYAIIDSPSGRILRPSGDWTVLLLSPMETGVHGDQVDALDLSGLGHIDTSGAFVLLRALKENGKVSPTHADFQRLAAVLRDDTAPPLATHPAIMRFARFERIGRYVIGTGTELFDAMAFTGALVCAAGRSLRAPSRLRLTPLFAVMEQAGLNAIPIVMTMTFFIGAVIALVGANLLADLGVAVFTVELVDVAILREFGVVIAAILLAGRSASAFAAEIGSMRMSQETDAMQVMGVDRFDALVMPRILAALLMMPLLTFCADIGGLLGGMLISWATMGVTPEFFVQRTLEMVTLTQFWLGMIKAPFLAVIIAAAGCRHGLAVRGDVASLGRAVTTAVVRSIFLIIMFDAGFAVLFRMMDV